MRLLLAGGMLLFCLRSPAQLPDLDEFGGDLFPETESRPTPVPEPQTDLPADHLFAGWEAIERLKLQGIRPPVETVVSVVLPEGPYLVAPNVPGIAEGYRRLSDFVLDHRLKNPLLLKVVLHADGKFSVALLLEQVPDIPIPPGLDISPLPRKEIAGMATDLQVTDRKHPAVLRAFLKLQSHAEASGWELDRREFIYLPLEPGLVFFGLEAVRKPDSSASKGE